MENNKQNNKINQRDELRPLPSHTVSKNDTWQLEEVSALFQLFDQTVIVIEFLVLYDIKSEEELKFKLYDIYEKAFYRIKKDINNFSKDRKHRFIQLIKKGFSKEKLGKSMIFENQVSEEQYFDFYNRKRTPRQVVKHKGPSIPEYFFNYEFRKALRKYLKEIYSKFFAELERLENSIDSSDDGNKKGKQIEEIIILNDEKKLKKLHKLLINDDFKIIDNIEEEEFINHFKGKSFDKMINFCPPFGLKAVILLFDRLNDTINLHSGCLKNNQINYDVLTLHFKNAGEEKEQKNYRQARGKLKKYGLSNEKIKNRIDDIIKQLQ